MIRPLGRAPSLARQVEAAIESCFDRGYRNVILLAGDVGFLRVATIAGAISLLDHDNGLTVIGPSGDGGFYLAGFNRRPGIDWSTIRWFTREAADSLKSAAGSDGLAVHEIETIDDIDSIADARRIARRPVAGFVSTMQQSLRSALGPAPARDVAFARISHAFLDSSLRRRPPPTHVAA